MKGADAALARAVGAAVKKAAAVDRTCVSSFEQLSVDTMRAEHPEIATSASVREIDGWTGGGPVVAAGGGARQNPLSSRTGALRVEYARCEHCGGTGKVIEGVGGA